MPYEGSYQLNYESTNLPITPEKPLYKPSMKGAFIKFQLPH